MPFPPLFRTSVFHLTLMYMALFGASVITLGVFLYWSTVGYLERQTDEVIEAEIASLEEHIRRGSLGGMALVIEDRVHRSDEERSAYLLVDASLRRVAGNLSSWPPEFNQPGEWVDFTAPNEAGDIMPFRARVLGVGSTGYRLLVGREIAELAQIKQTFRRAAIWGVSLTMGLALAGGLLMAMSAQRRVALLNRTTRQIMRGDFSQRVPVGGYNDEHEELATNVNAMLDQIEGLLAGIRHVGDSIAHDLRGPLTRLRTRLEMLIKEPAPSKKSLEECLAQADALLATFSALLRISRIESGAYRSRFESVDFGAIVGDVAELYQAIAEENGINIKCERDERDGKAVVFGDRELLAQALTNLLDNAVKYTPAGGTIDIRLTSTPERIVATVGDSGPGIPPMERERVLARFARLDEARSKPGNGLGLALVRAVADQHDATLTLTDNAPGLAVTLSLPAERRAAR
jgi:signal transduction histidine kinase